MADGVLGLLFQIDANPEKAKEALEAFKGHVETATSGAAASFQSLTSCIESGPLNSFGPAGVAFGAVTALGGALYEVAEKAAESGNQIYEASEKTGLAAETLSGLRAVAKQTGKNFDALTGALARAGRNLQVAIDQPGGKSAKVLADLMGGAQNLTQLGLKPMDERIQVVLQRIFALNEVGERNRALQALLGRGWQENIETLKAYANHLQEAIEQAKRFGTFYTAEEAAKAHEFEFQINTLKASLSGLATTIGREVIPAVNGMIQAFFNAQSAMRDSAKASEKWGEDLRAYVGGAVEFVTELITGKTSTWATAFISSGSIFRRELRRLGSSGPSGILLCNFDREENPESGCRRHLRQCAAGNLPEIRIILFSVARR